MLPGTIPMFAGIGGAPPAGLQHVTGVSDTNAGTSITFPSVPLGTPSPGRVMVVVASASRPLSTLTIGGVAATKRVSIAPPPTIVIVGGIPVPQDDVRLHISVFTHPLDAGATADIISNTTISSNRNISVYALYGATSDTPVATAVSSTGRIGTPAMNVNVTAGNFVLAAAAVRTTSSSIASSTGFTWTGLNDPKSVATGSRRLSTNTELATVTETPKAISASYDGAITENCGLSAVWA